MSVCRKRESDCTHVGCCRESVAACEFELRGHKAGKKCGVRLCSEHAGINFRPQPLEASDVRTLCIPHCRLLMAEAQRGKAA